MVTFPEIDSAAALRIPEIAQAQELHIKLHGRFAQLGKTHVQTPDASTPAVPSRDSFKLPSETVAWRDFSKLSSSMAFSMVIDNYCGPTGHGYVVYVRTERMGIPYIRAINVGPEAHRSHGWIREEVE